MRRLIPVAALIAFMAMMLIDPEYYLRSASDGLALFAVAVLPALFPFFFSATLLTKIGGAEVISKIGRRPVRFLFNSPPEGAYILTLSLLSGYPVGASMTAELLSAGAISRRQALTICAYASTSGPIFIMGTVGSAIFRNYALGIVVIASHYIAALLNGLIFREKQFSDRGAVPSMLRSDNAVSESITRSTGSMLAVGAYIVLCGMLIDTLRLTGIEHALTAVGGDGGGALLSLCYGAIEMTRGIMECAKLSDIQLAAALASAIVSFGGLSVILQSCTFLGEAGIPFRSVLLRKAVQSVLAFAVAFLLGFSLI